ncbi:hypothetical protein BAC2_01020 [uncultured bacterium]|nr:hypothetical protein BAC2_01020 [uncultured bacterium]
MRNLKSPFFAIVLLAAVLLLVGVPLLTRGSLVQEADPDDGQPIEWRSEPLGFRVSYPSKWQALTDPRELIGDNPTNLHAVAFVPNPGSKSLIIVYAQTLTVTETLDEYVTRQLGDLQANEANVVFAPPSPLKVAGGFEARETTALITTETPPRQQRVIMTVNGLRAYALYYTGPAEGRYAQAFDSLVQSFAFLP